MATNEFTKKLRAAIKTKIQELGIEVDDELPDYIMIMIANKKDKARMKSDLMLFLSDNTEPFVDWLFEFFEKVNKKETEEAKARESEKPVVKKRHSSEERVKSRSRSPVRRSRSRSPRRTTRHDEEKPKRVPIRAPSPKRERERSSRRKDDRRRRSRSAEDERKSRRRDERKKITYSDDDDEETRKTVRSHVVPKTEPPPSPKLSSQVVVKRRKADPADAKAGSSLFKRAMTDTLRGDDEPPRHKRKVDYDVLQVNTNQSSRRTVVRDDESDISEDEPETQFIVKFGKNAATRKAIRASMDDAPPGDENYAIQHEALKLAKRKRRAEDPVLAFLRLSGARAQKFPGEGEIEGITRKRLMLAAGSTASLAKQWNGKIPLDDDEDDEDESDDEAEIDAFLASAHDSRIPPTEALSRPLQYVVPQKKQFGAKAPETGKLPERCRFWPKCRNEETCAYSHPSKPCMNFPNCWFGDKCLFIHPQCKFEPNCSKPTCPYTHTLPRPIAPRATAAPRQPNQVPITPASTADSNGTAATPSSQAVSESPKKPVGGQTTTEGETAEQIEASVNAEENVTAENEQRNGTEEGKPGESETGTEKTEATQTADAKGLPDIPISAAKPSTTASAIKPLNMSLQASSNVLCRFGGRCHNEACTFRHPKRCRFDEACTNESCYFWHPKKNAGRFRWVKT